MTEWPRDVTTDEILDACPCGRPHGARLRTLKGIAESCNNWLRRSVSVWVYDFLISQFDYESVQGMLADRFVESNDDLFRALEDGDNPTFSITAGRFVSFYGDKRVYDCEAGDWVSGLPPTWIETRVFNLGRMVEVCVNRVTHGRGRGAGVDR